VSEQADAVKIGVTSDPSRRMQQIQTGFPYPDLKVAAQLLLETRSAALACEAALHKALEQFQTHREWFQYRPLAGLVAAFSTAVLTKDARLEIVPRPCYGDHGHKHLALKELEAAFRKSVGISVDRAMADPVRHAIIMFSEMGIEEVWEQQKLSAAIMEKLDDHKAELIRTLEESGATESAKNVRRELNIHRKKFQPLRAPQGIASMDKRALEEG
jgi:hypothetical protein